MMKTDRNEVNADLNRVREHLAAVAKRLENPETLSAADAKKISAELYSICREADDAADNLGEIEYIARRKAEIADEQKAEPADEQKAEPAEEQKAERPAYDKPANVMGYKTVVNGIEFEYWSDGWKRGTFAKNMKPGEVKMIRGSGYIYVDLTVRKAIKCVFGLPTFRKNAARKAA